jgi:hypothetical protein
MTNTSKLTGFTTPEDDPHLTGNFVESEESENEEVDKEETTSEGTELEGTESKGESESGDEEADILPQFKGKSKKEISDIYANLLKEHGRQGKEVGDLRQAAREWLFNESRKNAKDNQTEITDDDFVERPREAVKSVVEDSLEPVNKQLESVNRQLGVANLLRKHPDLNDIVKTSEFHTWVQGSPYRQRLFDRADNYDFDASDELISLYKETRSVAEAKDSKAAKQKELKKAASESSGAPSGGKGKKKIWSSAQLIHLKITNPSKYNELQPEIMLAYQEGRVK